MIDSTPAQSGIVAGRSFVQRIVSPHRFTFRNGVSTGASTQLPLNWDDLEYLARALANGVAVPAHHFVVHVMCSGGTYTMTSLFGQTPVAHASGRRVLVVAFTNEPIVLYASSFGRQFEASILAPFSHVKVDASVGYVDGFIVAKSLEMKSNAGSVQLHGNCFRGSFVCPSTATAAPVCSNAARATCSDRLQARRCMRKLRKAKCGKRRMQQKCAQTCGLCAG